ncbi:hypothetical protein HGM15179_013711 [Zosterops borbonicus]|uniref:Uncharacterized protein n=1 Tax=Zosterops borbonicus TaxID=364589 RepID=A0A8K1G820_9PASS|nr:hypothetical protein HGM15179_013711 [Zosterops borbonicus]
MFPDKAPHTLCSPGKQGRLPKSPEHPSPSSFQWETPLKSGCGCPQFTSLKTQVAVKMVVKQAGKGASRADMTEVCDVLMSPEKISDEKVMTHCLLCMMP